MESKIESVAIGEGANPGSYECCECVLIGIGAATKGYKNLVIGNSYVEGDNNIVMGDNNKVVGNGNVILGNNKVVTGDHQTFIGEANEEWKDAELYCHGQLLDTLRKLLK